MASILNNTDPRTGPSFTLVNRLGRLAWNITYNLFFRFSPAPLHKWRSFLLKLFGAKMGRGCHIYPKVRVWAPWNLVCRDKAGVADGVILYNQARITIGKEAVISQGSHLCTGTHDYESNKFRLVAKPIKVGDKAWICADCFVNPGVKIGDGAVIGAKSVVTKKVPGWMVCAGNPCRVIKKREIRDE